MPVALDAACDDIIPGLASSLGNRNHVVVGELGHWSLLVTILATVAVSSKKVLSTKFDPVGSILEANIVKQA